MVNVSQFIKNLVFLTLFMLSSLNVLANEDKHTIGIFLGVTNAEETETTFGLEYEYKFTYQFGISADHEQIPDADNGDGLSVYLILGYWHIDSHWRLGLGVGEEKGSHSKTESLTRLSAAYDFHINNFGIAPTISLDNVGSETNKVYGVTFNKFF